MQDFGFKELANAPCVYIRGAGRQLIILIAYVDDIVLFSKSKGAMGKAAKDLGRKVKITVLGELSSYLGVDFQRHQQGVQMSQPGYIDALLQKFHLENGPASRTPAARGGIDRELSAPLKPDQDYRSLVGGLLYLAIRSRPDIGHAVGILARHVSYAKTADWKAAVRVLRHLAGTKTMYLPYDGHGDVKLEYYADADFGGADDRKSTTEIIIFLGEPLVYWQSSKQKTVALSTAESELYAQTEAIKQVILLCKVREELGYKPAAPTSVFQDNTTARLWGQAGGARPRAKYIDLRTKFAEPHVGQNLLLLPETSYEMKAGLMTKVLPQGEHDRQVKCLSMKE